MNRCFKKPEFKGLHQQNITDGDGLDKTNCPTVKSALWFCKKKSLCGVASCERNRTKSKNFRKQNPKQ